MSVTTQWPLRVTNLERYGVASLPVIYERE